MRLRIPGGLGMIHLGDITQIKGMTIPPVDAVIGGSPCQDLSVAGRRAGLAGNRSGLYIEQIRVIKEMREADKKRGRTGVFIRPRYMVWENVPGAFSSNGGKDFGAVLEEAIRVAEPEAPDVPLPEKGWPNAGCLYDEMGGWSVAWRVHDGQFWGTTYYDDAGNPIWNGTPQRRKRIALVADFGGLSAPEILFERKGLSGDSEESGTARKRNAASVENCPASAVWNTEAPSVPIGCLTEHRHVLVYDARGNGNGLTAPKLTGDHQNRVTDYTAICCQNTGNLFGFPLGFRPENTMLYAETATTLCNGTRPGWTAGIAAVDCRSFTESNVNGTLQAKDSGGTSLNLNNVCRTGSIVRRLTPLECERLQGFPDGWTDIGEWVDTKGKRHKEADTPRYKALGNSICLPFWFWLLRRISAQYERPATMGSLFDGIGGFPLCWERCNGKGTARWASEIEEFPIAVTKYHFCEEKMEEKYAECKHSERPAEPCESTGKMD